MMPIDGPAVQPRTLPLLDVVSVANPTTTVVPILIMLAKSTRALLGIKLAEIGFHNGQDEFLLVLDEGAPVCVSTLSERVSVRPSTVSKMIDRLAEKRLVYRVADTKDSRRTMVRITPSGIAAKAVIQRVHDRIENDLTNDMNRVELATMRAGLAVAQDRLTARLMRLR